MTANSGMAALIACIGCIAALTKAPEERLKKFHQAYAGKWPATMTYVRDVVWTEYNRRVTYRRHHAIKFPDKMREDIDINAGTSNIRVNGNDFFIKKFRYNGSFPARRDMENFISIYCYSESFDSVKNYLIAAGVDLAKGYQTSWKGRKVYVVGALSVADTTSTQIWYDEADMYPVRLIQTYPADLNRYQYRFVMQKSGNIWFPSEMEQYKNSRVIYKSTYSKIKMDVPLEPGVFNPDKFGSYLWYEYSPS